MVQRELLGSRFSAGYSLRFAAIGAQPLISISLRGVSIETVAHWKSLSAGIQVRHLIRSGPPGR